MHEARALWFTAPLTAELRDEEVGDPGPGEVLVRTIASAVSQGTELLVYRGQVSADLPLDLPTLAGGYGFPIKYGYAAVGRVVGAGPGVAEPGPGTPVFVHHPHQSLFTVPAVRAVPLPSDIDPVLGVFTANLETALNIVLDTQVRLGETALVFGLGVVGQLVAQLMRRAGAEHVIGVDPVPARRHLAKRLGADAALAPGGTLPVADVAIEVSGAPAALQEAIEAVAPEGTVVVASWYGTKPVPLLLGDSFHRGRVRLRSSQVGRLDPALAPRWDAARRLEVAVGLLSRLPLPELITARRPFAESPQVYRQLDEHPADEVQTVLTYGDGR
jgi:2-desacetyl-2-hydroxyethyl bacteriochlorophyllide A dehydrogenase